MLIQWLFAFCFLLFQVLKVSASITESESLEKPSKFNLLCSDIIIHIGRYLAVPQKNLGLVNKNSYNALFKIYPLKCLINERLNIPELLNSENESELIFFERIMSVSDPLHLFYAIATGTLEQNVFPGNGRLLTNYISRILPNLIEEFGNALDPDLTSTGNIAFNLLSYGDFDSLFELFKGLSRRFKNFFIHLDIVMDKLFIERLMKYESGAEIYETLLNSLDSISSQSKFIACSILNNSVAEELFLPKLTSSKILIQETFKFIFFESFELENFDFLIFQRISRCLNHLQSNFLSEDQDEIQELQAEIEHFNLINGVRFGPINEDILDEIKNKEYPTERPLKELALAALLSDKRGLFFQIANDHVTLSNVFEDEFNNETIQNIFILNLFPLLSMKDKRIIYNNYGFFNFISYYYGPRSITENAFLSIDFKLRHEYNNLPLPQTFTYYYSVESESIEIDGIFSKLFDQLQHISCTDLMKLISSVSNCPIFNQIIVDSRHFPIYTTFEALDLISRYRELHALVDFVGIHFTTDEDSFAKLLETPSKHMNSTINFDEFYMLLPLLITKNQLKNLEEFLDKSIDEVFFQNILPNIGEEINMKMFFEFRIALNYWLEGPNRERLLQLNIPQFRRLLANESSIEDAIFLTKDLIDDDHVVQGIQEDEEEAEVVFVVEDV